MTRLTTKQQELLEDINNNTTKHPVAWFEGERREWRSAQALQRKGLLEIRGDQTHFEVRLLSND